MREDFDLDRFLDAQDEGGAIDRAQRELAAGAKRSHWMWFIFPQGPLGRSAMAERFAIRSLAEARAYLRHAVLGPRLRACVQQVMTGPCSSVATLFPPPDDQKFRSSMTLFALAAEAPEPFDAALRRFGLSRCPLTIALFSADRCG